MEEGEKETGTVENEGVFRILGDEVLVEELDGGLLHFELTLDH